MSSLALVTIRSSIASPRVGVSATWVKKLSSMRSRSLLDCLQLAVLLFQQMSGWIDIHIVHWLVLHLYSLISIVQRQVANRFKVPGLGNYSQNGWYGRSMLNGLVKPMCYKFFCPIDRSEDYKNSPFKTMQKANATAHSASPVSAIGTYAAVEAAECLAMSPSRPARRTEPPSPHMTGTHRQDQATQ
ncbi:hypothetical protein QYF61_000902 [Mycteria americana]|uniref:Uncharacterized protein n=1 Tax=Mycteria americana TaxID=33587 RepID=A0AAN7S514_MYCAM|nr:hypothetical protein QYF61_000902 [Mycteria americana]